ncbi:hypothetical protein PsorP6_007715 [Peronosclerospora sorghi]|uniref:Uncharacterized protein n=1 Tax=Peronosclerospora sorghi TaxID=230839 RepID=A0ACC0WC30_9STRA|nr:hypothetical protein PsorP6_007715 [Peronosclerospora sorghi]
MNVSTLQASEERPQAAHNELQTIWIDGALEVLSPLLCTRQRKTDLSRFTLRPCIQRAVYAAAPIAQGLFRGICIYHPQSFHAIALSTRRTKGSRGYHTFENEVIRQ